MKTIRLWIATIATLLCSLSANAHDFEVDGIYYNIANSTENTVSVTYKGGHYDSYKNEYRGRIIIPEAVMYNDNIYQVVSIDWYTFRRCEISSITIPKSVTSIGITAFGECSSLKEVIFEDGNSILELSYNDGYHGEDTFFDCPLESLYIGRDLIYNDNGVVHTPFYYKEELSSLIIGESVTSIIDNAFQGCKNLCTIINYSDIILTKGSSDNGEAARYAKKVVNMKICNSINGLLFDSNDDIHFLVDYMGNDTEILLPNNYNGENFQIDAYAFYGSNEMTSVVISEGVTSISEMAFSNCSKITSIVIPDNVISIGSSAFSGCSDLESAIIGDGVTEIGDNTFYGCSSLTNLTIGSSVSSIGGSAFAGCNEIESIYALNTKAITCDESIFATDAYNNAILYVPSDRVFAYEKVTPWNKFQIEPMKKFTVTYMVDGKVYKTIETEYAAEIILPENPTKDGHTFIGWSEVPKTMPANDITIYGSFAINKYFVTFKIGDEVIASDSIEYGTSIVIPEAPEKEGYTFNGWVNVPETVPACNLTFEGGYTANEYLLAFIVDGALYEMHKVRCDEIITALDMVEREGYTFVWENWIDKMPAKDYTVRGKYIPNKYAITYMVDGEIVVTDSIVYGTIIEALEEPAKEGYTFSGWSEVPETMPAEDVVINGFFTVNIYKVYYYVGDVLVHTAEVAYGESIPEYVYEPTAEGDEFMGWVGETYETMPAHDVTYTANITNEISQCTISNSQLTIYDLNGRKIETNDLRELEKGIYIVNGKKVMIK